MNKTKLILFTLLISFLISFLQLTLTYNVNVTNLIVSFYLFSLNCLLLYNVMLVIFLSLKLKSKNNLFISYIEILSILFVYILPLESIFILFSSFIVVKELSISIFLKFVLVLFSITLIATLLFFLIRIFRSYYWIWILGFGGTIVLSTLMVEAMYFVRNLWLKSLMNLWSVLVPFQAIAQLQNLAVLEGWQNVDLLLFYVLWLLLYWFVVVSFCLYVKQLKVSLVT